MGEHTSPPEERRPIDVEGVPNEEGMSEADAAERVETDADEQVNRPDQPDFDESERRQYESPPADVSIADADQPEDR